MIDRKRLAAFIALVPELFLTLIVVGSFGWVTLFFVENGYLPQPFIFDTNDTFMDWFNTAYWANNPGAYSVWKTIYPPLSFAFLKFFSLSDCYLSSPFQARDCDWLGHVTILIFYLIDIVLAYIAFSRLDRSTAPLRGLVFALGLPTLFALERGNLIIPCLAFFILGHSQIVKSEKWRLFSMAVTINFKPYLLLPVLPLALRRQWRALEVAGIATVTLYLATFALVGAGSPGEVLENTRTWVTFQSGQVWNEIYYSTSYATLLQIQTSQFPILKFVPSRTIETVAWVVPLAIRASQAIALLCVVAAWLQPRALPLHRLSTLLLATYLATQSPGGYTQCFLIFLVFLEPWRRPGPVIAIVAAYMLSISSDLIIASIISVTTKSWLGGVTVTANFGLSLGQFVRPGLIIIIVWALALDSLARVIAAHRTNRPTLGFKSRAHNPRLPTIA